MNALSILMPIASGGLIMFIILLVGKGILDERHARMQRCNRQLQIQNKLMVKRLEHTKKRGNYATR